MQVIAAVLDASLTDKIYFPSVPALNSPERRLSDSVAHFGIQMADTNIFVVLEK